MVDAFIIILLMFMWCWDYPADHPAKRFAQKWSFPFLYMGLWHGWAMFAPDPIHVNRRLRAMMTFADGITEMWTPLGPDNEARVMKTLYARNFKYEHFVLGPQVLHLFRPLCDFLTRQAQLDGRQLTSIELFRDFRYVNPCGSKETYSQEHSILFYRYDAVKRSGAPVAPPVR